MHQFHFQAAKKAFSWGIASFAIFQFLWVWKDLLVALVFLGTNPDVAIVTARLSARVGTKGEAWQLLTAGAFLTMIILLIVFFSLQRYFVRGLLAGGGQRLRSIVNCK